MSNGKENSSFNVIENIKKLRNNHRKNNVAMLDNSLLKLARAEEWGECSEMMTGSSNLLTMSELKQSINRCDQTHNSSQVLVGSLRGSESSFLLSQILQKRHEKNLR